MLFLRGLWQSPKCLPYKCGAQDTSVAAAPCHARSWIFGGCESERAVLGGELRANTHLGKKAALQDACDKQEPSILVFHKEHP